MSHTTEYAHRGARGPFPASVGLQPAAGPCGPLVHELFEIQAARTPDSIAVRCGDEILTYGELNRRANRLAHYLRKRGVGPDVLVVLCVERSLEMVMGLLGILKAGGAYVPVDPEFPKDRIAFMLEDSRAHLLLSQGKLAQRLPESRPEIICLDAVEGFLGGESPQNLAASTATPDNLAYVIYTSGSTGKPKGVQIPHRAVVNFLTSMAREPGLTAQDCLLAVTTLSFDIAGLELFLPLTVGGRVVVASRGDAADGTRLARLLDSQGVTAMQATPVTWRLLLEAGWLGNRQLKILCGGEAWPRALADQLLARCGSLWNMYGPTETTIWSLVARVEAGNGPVPMGRPIANTRVYVLDEHLQPVPAGVAGELHIGGVGLARGYLRRDALTAEKFINDPFAGPGARLYKTGDRVRYRADGSLEFLGRLDNQVKVRGFRIELGEIEAALGAFPGVGASVAVVREDRPGDPRLVAYFIAQPGRGPAPEDLRLFLHGRLPEYMVPAAFVQLTAFPHTPNGKVDRRALPAPSTERRDADGGYLAPQDSLELWLARLCEEVLAVRPIGVQDNLLELGADSLLLARLVAKIQQKFRKHVSPALVLEAPTVKQMAQHLREGGPASRWTSLVLLQPGGAGTPFFCVHGGAGGIFLFQPLAKHLGKDRPVFGLQAVDPGEQSTPHTTVEQMAAHYVREIRTVQPQGPYLLGGFCFGGCVAYEMARQLREAGSEVGLVALIHAFNPAAVPKLKPDAPSPGASNEQKNSPARPGPFRRVVRRLRRGWGGAQHVLRLTRLWTWRTGKRFLVAAYQVAGRPLPQDLRDFLVHDNIRKAELRYVPKSGQTRVAVFRTELTKVDPYLGIEPDLGWGSVVPDLEIHSLPVLADARRGLIREPFVRQLAERLGECCRRAEAAPERPTCTCHSET